MIDKMLIKKELHSDRGVAYIKISSASYFYLNNYKTIQNG